MSAEARRPMIKSYTCACGWTRQWNVDYRGDRMITHPRYGIRKAKDVAILDIQHHDCAENYKAVRRARQLFGKRSEGYAPYLPDPVSEPQVDTYSEGQVGM